MSLSMHRDCTTPVSDTQTTSAISMADGLHQGISGSPISRLSLDVLSLVFEYLVLGNEFGIRSRPNLESAASSPHDLFQLGLVCKEWRACTMGYAELWSRFYIYLNESGDETLPFLDTILQRSKKCNLSFRVVQSSTLGESTKDILRAVSILRRLFEECYRWKSVIFDLTKDLLLPWFNFSDSSQSPLFLPKLEALFLDFALADQDDLPSPRSALRRHSPLFSLLPKIEDIKIDAIFIPSQIHGWHNCIASLEVEGLSSINKAHELVSYCRNTLVELSLGFDLILDNESLLRSEHALPRVEVLSLIHFSCNFDLRQQSTTVGLYVKLIDALSFPILSQLSLEVVDWNDSWILPGEIQDALLDLVGGSECFLEGLDLRWIDLSDSSFLRDLTSLKILSCTTHSLPLAIQEALVVHHAPILPSLSSIELFVRNSQDAEMVQEIIESRRGVNGGRLSRARLKYDDEFDPVWSPLRDDIESPTFKEWVDALQQEAGFTLEIEVDT